MASLRFEELLEQRIREQIETCKEDMAAGLMDPKTYDRTAGGILACRTILEIFYPEIRKILNQD